MSAAPRPPAGGSPAGGEAEALARYRAAARRRRAAEPDPGAGRRGQFLRRSGRGVAGTPSGPGPDPRDPQRIGPLFTTLADGRGWTADMAVWSLANRWAQIVGPQVAEHVAVVSFDPDQVRAPAAAAKGNQEALLPLPGAQQPPEPAREGGKLTLRADSNSWQQQMVWNLVHLQRRLNEELGPGVVGAIVVLGPPDARRRYGPRSV